MNKELLTHIEEVYDGGAWEAITGLLWEDGQPWQLFKFEQDVDYNRQLWRCLIIRRCVFDPDDVSAVDYTEDIFVRAWEI